MCLENCNYTQQGLDSNAAWKKKGQPLQTNKKWLQSSLDHYALNQYQCRSSSWKKELCASRAGMDVSVHFLGYILGYISLVLCHYWF